MSKQNRVRIRFAVQSLAFVIIWICYSRVPLKTFFIDHELLYLLVLAIPLAGLINFMSVKKPPLWGIILVDILFCVIGFKAVVATSIFNCLLLIINVIIINGLLLTSIINENHCAWILYGISTGSGLVLLFNLTYNHYLSLNALMFITLLIFSTTLFSFPLFFTSGNRISLILISVLTFTLLLVLKISLLMVLLLIAITGFYLLFDFAIEVKNRDKRIDVATICELVFAVILTA